MSPVEQNVRTILTGAFVDQTPSDNILDPHMLDKLRHMIADVPYPKWGGYLLSITDDCVRGSLCAPFVITVFDSVMKMMDAAPPEAT